MKTTHKAYKKRVLTTAISSILAIGAANAVAQEVIEEVVVTGIRGSLRQSLDVKRASTQIVDAITAEDVGKFPDTNVAESLQRITGVAIDRSGGEGQFITVRGLGPEFNTVLLNGRTLATDNDGREFSFDVLSSDIIQRAEVFKTATPGLPSGGIGATVNIVTSRPLESGAGTNFAFSVANNYDDLRESNNPELGGVFTIVNDDETIGFTLGVSHSERSNQIDSVFTNGFAARGGDPIVNAAENSVGLGAADIGTLPAGARVQQQVVISRNEQDRERTTFNSTFQARPSSNVEITVDGLYSEFDIESFDRQFSGFFSPPFINPVVDANGTVTSFSRPSVDFQNRNPDIASVVGLSQNDNVITANNREAQTYLVGGNIKWDLNDRWTLNFDLSKSNATRDGTNPFVVLGALAPESPLIELPADAEISTITNLVGLQDTSIQRLHFVNVVRQQVEDDITEFSVNADVSFDEGNLNKISFGVAGVDRTKERAQFDNFAPTQGAGVFCAYCGYTVDFDDSILSPVTLDGFLSDASGSNRLPTAFLTSSFEQAFAQLNDATNLNDPNRTGSTPAADLIARRDAAGGSIFGFYEPDLNPAASFQVDEEITSLFFNSEWEGTFGRDIPWSANVGFRYTRTETTSLGVDQPVLQISESPGDTQLQFMFGPTTNVSVDNSYTNFLPSANIRFDTSENTVLRFALSETLTRPTLTALGVNNTFGGRSNAPTSGGGNPDLDAFEATNYDVAFEWYIDDITFFGVSAFYKEFENFLEAATLPVTRQIVIPAGNASNPSASDITLDVDFQDTRTRNGETGSISGLEIAYQQAFDNGLGYGVNYTYVDSSIDRAPGSGASSCDYNGLSPNTLNVNGFYEQGPWAARVAYNYRDEFLFQCFSNFSEPRQREEFGQVDISASFNVGGNFQIFFEGINILDEDTRDFSRFQNRFLTYEETGARYSIGFRGSF